MPRVPIAIAVTLFAALTTVVVLQVRPFVGPFSALKHDQAIVIFMMAVVFAAWLGRRLAARRARRATHRRFDADRNQVQSVYAQYAQDAETEQLRYDLDRWGRELCYMELRGPVERTHELTAIVRILRAELERRAAEIDGAAAMQSPRERMSFESDRPLPELIR